MAEQTPSGIPVPVLPRREAPVGTSRRRPWVVVVSLLAILLIVPFAIALVFSTLEDLGGGFLQEALVQLVLGLVVLGLAAGMSALLRSTSAPRWRAARAVRDESAAAPRAGSPASRRSGLRPGR